MTHHQKEMKIEKCKTDGCTMVVLVIMVRGFQAELILERINFIKNKPTMICIFSGRRDLNTADK